MYNSPLPWYLKRDTTIDKMEGGVSNWGVV
jgi:hypothetical protein